MIVGFVRAIFGVAHDLHSIAAAGVREMHPLLQAEFETSGLVVVAHRNANLVGESGIAVGGGESKVSLQTCDGRTPVNVIKKFHAITATAGCQPDMLGKGAVLRRALDF